MFNPSKLLFSLSFLLISATSFAQLDCGCLKDVAYGSREYSYSNACGDSSGQSALISKARNAGAYLKNLGEACFGQGEIEKYLQKYTNEEATDFSYEDVVSCINSNVSSVSQLRTALKNINQMNKAAVGWTIFDESAKSILFSGALKTLELGHYTELTIEALHAAHSVHEFGHIVSDTFSYLVIKDDVSCRTKYLKEYYDIKE